ncbi:hypothetical protein COLO4_18430 [Corchorus olitorius]|uniref:Uncharacterized protein n=1 Tax=Corchorus olitorius TaxID=93759 RepID=A0A1R3J920_9ROSI|nr:hypothetical protein COLO4_18430 [Corchorus olitorius]
MGGYIPLAVPILKPRTSKEYLVLMKSCLVKSQVT